jgi:hypothetical protein
VFWLAFAGAVLFWAFGAVIVASMLSMSVPGRLQGGAGLNAAVTIYALLWLTCPTALAIALWKSRDLPAPISLWSLARGPRPADERVRPVWWWARLYYAGWLSVMAFLALLAWSGLLGR